MKKLIMLLIFCCSFAYAQRCENGLVQIGDSKSSVLIKCGEPLYKDNTCKQMDGRSRPVCYPVEELTYKPDIGLYTTYVIKDGKVLEINLGERVD